MGHVADYPYRGRNSQRSLKERRLVLSRLARNGCALADGSRESFSAREPQEERGGPTNEFATPLATQVDDATPVRGGAYV